MNYCFSVDATSPNAYLEVGNYLLKKLQMLTSKNTDIIFLCIGSDRSTGDSLGPLIGYKLKSSSKNNIHIFGSLDTPIHSKNIEEIIKKIHTTYSNPFIIAIDSCLGNIHNIGKVFISDEPLQPGLALNKSLPSVGNMSIKGVVNISGTIDFIVLQNTRLYTVMTLADCIAKGISLFIFKSVNDDLDYFNKSET